MKCKSCKLINELERAIVLLDEVYGVYEFNYTDYGIISEIGEFLKEIGYID